MTRKRRDDARKGDRRGRSDRPATPPRLPAGCPPGRAGPPDRRRRQGLPGRPPAPALGAAALNPLIALLVAEKRTAELQAAVEKEFNINPNDVDRLAAVAALKSGDKDRATELARLAVQGDPKALDVRLWQAEVLKALGKSDEAEAALREAIRLEPHKPGPRLALLMLQISQRKTADAAATVEQIRAERRVRNQASSCSPQCYRGTSATSGGPTTALPRVHLQEVAQRP